MSTTTESSDMGLDPDDLRTVDCRLLDYLTEGRVTPAYARERLEADGVGEYSRGYVQQRLSRLVEHDHAINQADAGLYELVDDPRDDGATSAGSEELLDQLEAAAREQWGERWTITARFWADGDCQAYAQHNRGRVERDDVDEAVLEVEQLWLDPETSERVLKRLHLRQREIVEELDSSVV